MEELIDNKTFDEVRDGLVSMLDNNRKRINEALFKSETQRT